MHTVRFILLAVILTLAAVLSAGCGPSDRGDDAAPVSENVLPQPATNTPAPTEPAATPTPVPAGNVENPVLVLEVSGGPLNFCDTLTIQPSGQYTLHSCQADFDQLSGTLEAGRLEELQKWQTSLQDFSLTPENPADSSNLQASLRFDGQGKEAPDEVLQRFIFDWANGLLVQVRQRAVAEIPTPTPINPGPGGFCPTITRPAVFIADYDNPSNLVLADPATQETCSIPLEWPPFGRIAAAGGRIYFPVLNPDAKTFTIWQVSLTGEQSPLEFTTVSADQPGPYSFTVSADGTRLAWAYTTINFDADPPTYRRSLWVAQIDGSGLVALIDGQEDTTPRFLEPVQFSPDNRTLYYALQPDGVQGDIFSFGGIYDTFYAVSVDGVPQELAACPESAPYCLGGISADGTLISRTVISAGQVELLNGQGEPVAVLTPAAGDYIGPAIFSPGGRLAFVAADLTEPDESGRQKVQSSVVYLASPPYADPPQAVLQDRGAAAVWDWLDDERLVFGTMDDEGNIGTSVYLPDGQVKELSANFPLTVLR